MLYIKTSLIFDVQIEVYSYFSFFTSCTTWFYFYDSNGIQLRHFILQLQNSSWPPTSTQPFDLALPCEVVDPKTNKSKKVINFNYKTAIFGSFRRGKCKIIRFNFNE